MESQVIAIIMLNTGLCYSTTYTGYTEYMQTVGNGSVMGSIAVDKNSGNIVHSHGTMAVQTPTAGSAQVAPAAQVLPAVVVNWDSIPQHIRSVWVTSVTNDSGLVALVGLSTSLDQPAAADHLPLRSIDQLFGQGVVTVNNIPGAADAPVLVYRS